MSSDPSSSGSGSIWERITRTSRRNSLDESKPTPSLLPSPSDKEGMELYAQFQDCLDHHKGHAFLAIGCLTAPWSIYKRSVAPLVIGTILGFVPDMIYANYRCDGHYRKFNSHVKAVLDSSKS